MKKLMKNLIIVLCTLSLIALAGCDNSSDDEANVPTTEELIASQYDSLTSALSDTSTADDVISYVENWAEEEDISYDQKNGSLILKADDKAEMTLEYTIDVSQLTVSMENLSELMYLVSENSNVEAIICTEGSSEKLTDDMVSSDNVIALSYGEKMSFVTEAAASTTL